MDSIITIVDALTNGAIAGIKPTAAQVIKDAYAGLKSLIQRKYGNLSLDALERKPDSEAKRASVIEDLTEASAGNDKGLNEILNQAKILLDAVKTHDREVAAKININLGEMVAEGDINIDLKNYNYQNYMVNRGPAAYQAFVERPNVPWDSTISNKETVEDLRTKLLYGRHHLNEPIQITIKGVLFPCALLSGGWWERHSKINIEKIKWRDEIQRWLFHGFDLWGPSWDFTWDFENWETSKNRPFFIAQLGEGDEANSIPVLIPSEKAKKLKQYISENGEWGGIDAEITGALGHRSHFSQYVNHGAFDIFGGLLDYCLWIDRDNNKHGIQPLTPQTLVYSGYLWSCIIPKSFIKDGRPSLHDTYFIWEHTNFASKDAMKYSLDALKHKEEYLKERLGDELLLVQKSSSLVPGTPSWNQEKIYNLLLEKAGKVGEKI